MKRIISAFVGMCFILTVHSQSKTNEPALQQIAKTHTKQFLTSKNIARQFARTNGLPERIDTMGMVMEIIYIDDHGKPQYYATTNVHSAKSIGTSVIKPGGSLGFDLDGSGILLHEWDGGTVEHEHPEILGNVFPQDYNSSNISKHATHVAGTIAGVGANNMAEGMAPNAILETFDWNNDEAEMADEAAQGAILSNHSYGFIRGWGPYNSWYGNEDISVVEDYLFGFYDENSRQWDEIAYYAPDYLIVKSAGNDRGDQFSGIDPLYPPDGPYDCISQKGVAKNVLTVGAVQDLPAGYSGSSSVIMSSFSSWGPADDGRIKPDIVANGMGMLSCTKINYDGEAIYESYNGTSMASPSVTGSCGLLQQHYQNLNGQGNFMRAASLKALLIHTADEAGSNPGPDYQFGWGLMNTASAALKISEDQVLNVISEQQLVMDETIDRQVYVNGNKPLKVTLVWTDVPGTPASPQLDPSDPMLVNDLDLKIIKDETTWFPWKLDRDNPANAASQVAENNIDNVEVIWIENPEAGFYTIRVDHDGTLQNELQNFSLIISGISEDIAPVAQFRTMNDAPDYWNNIQFRDESFGDPTSWNWTFVPDYVIFKSGTSANSQHPLIQFEEPIQYEVTLTVSNAFGSDQVSKQIFIEPSGCSYPSTFYGGSGGNNLPINHILFNTISNNSSAVAGNYPSEDYTDFETHIFKGSVVPLTVKTDIEYQSSIVANCIAWFDWNQDCDFDDEGEAYNLGSFYNSIDEVLIKTKNIQIPFSAVSGKTRMRIAIRDGSPPLPDLQTLDLGEVEDYTVIVHSTDYPGFWTGLSSREWERGSNWSGGEVPGPSINVLIPSSASRFPALSNSLDIGGDIASLELESNTRLSGNIHSSIKVSSTLTLNPGSVISNPQSFQVYSGGTLIMDNASIIPNYEPTSQGNLFANILFLEGSTASLTGGEITFGSSFSIRENVNWSSMGGTTNIRSSYSDNNSKVDIRSNLVYFGDFIIEKGTNTSYLSSSLVDFEVTKLLVKPTASFSLESGNDMLIYDNLILQDSPGKNTGSFINNGNVVIENESVEIYQHLQDSRWHFVSSPVPDAFSSVFLGLYLKAWDETTYTWNYITETDLNLPVGQGFISWSTLGDPTVNYTSTDFNDQDVSPVLSATDISGDPSIGDGEGWNLVGNPFTSALDWGTENDPVAGFNLVNMQQSIYIWDGSQYASFNPAADGTGTNGGSRYVPALQSFFIKANDFSPQMTLPASARTHATQISYKSKPATENITLSAGNTKFSDETHIRFMPGGTVNFDSKYDAYKLFGIEEAPQLYSMWNGKEYSINTLAEISNDLVVPIGLFMGVSGDIEIMINIPESVSEDQEIYLEDLLDGSLQQIAKSFTKTISVQPQESKHRFNLHFKTTNAIDVPDEQDQIHVYSYNGHIYISCNHQESMTLSIVNMIGQKVYQENLEMQKLKRIDPNLQTGYYVVYLQNESHRITEKIFLGQ